MRHIITETCLRMLIGIGTATVRKKHHHRQCNWSLIDAQPTYPTLKEFPGQLPQPQCHPVRTYGL